MKKIIPIIITLLITACSSNGPINKKKSILYYGHGTQKLIEKDYTQALSFLLKAYELDKKNTDILTNLGMAYYFKKKLEISKSYFEKAIEADPKNSDARNNLASIHLEQKNYSLAKKHYTIIKSELTYPKQFRTKYNLALIELQVGDRQIGVELLKEASKEKVDYCAANNLLGQTYYDLKKYKNALKWYKKATMGKCYEQPVPHYYIGKTLTQLARYDEAIQKFIELRERFSQSRYSALSSLELKKIRTLRSELTNDKKNWSKWGEGKGKANFKSPSF